ncbi:copper resistance protein CopD [Nocardia cyriacigeorgica]|uniref:Copper resistance protein CopD n=1 Tax=Nocardia cyriacigeorgica TaxID=135487 RepID=A0A6P1D1E5_9NOCA|nr:CopD family protein [Nocardia cyriacigeorgica]NEW38318.1 copper resistance protein CopD [Nocardia cyriacigeorgica]NEW44335.1 copper resistance protein CopD [Nocardia cyriacigeorgica]NEW49261.1 copper resistance protein CopD [Nocardia cyriacigeorgica]
MTDRTTGGRDRRAALLLVVPSGLLGVLVAWVMTAVTAESAVRVLADIAGATVLGLAALPRVHDRLRPPWRLLAVVAGIWCGSEFVVLVFEAADVVGVPVSALDGGRFGTFLTEISGGQVGIAILLGTGAVACYSALAFRRPETASPDLVLVFAAVALTLRPITGHMSQQPFGSVLAAVHALAAGAWLGLLIGLALVVRSRGEWAIALPRYSTVAMPLVAVVAVTGLVNGLVRIGGVAPLVQTGYGRVLLAKTVILAALLALGWWWRRDWVGRAADHRMTAEASLRRATIEVVVMAVAFGLAATLAVTA